MPRVTVRAHPEMADDSPHQWGAEVVVTLTSGERLASRIDDYPRRGPGGDPMRREELWAKFENCAGLALPRAQVAPLFALLEKLDALPNLTEASRLMECRKRRVAGAAE
jgi:2-methylcitrate dehydratase PrpD